VKGAAKRVRPKVPAAGEAWQGGEVASHEVNRAPGTHLDSEHAHLLGCFPRPSGKASGEVSLDEAWRAAGARDVREPFAKFNCIAVDSSLAEPVLPPVALRPCPIALGFQCFCPVPRTVRLQQVEERFDQVTLDL